MFFFVCSLLAWTASLFIFSFVTPQQLQSSSLVKVFSKCFHLDPPVSCRNIFFENSFFFLSVSFSSLESRDWGRRMFLAVQIVQTVACFFYVNTFMFYYFVFVVFVLFSTVKMENNHILIYLCFKQLFVHDSGFWHKTIKITDFSHILKKTRAVFTWHFCTCVIFSSHIMFLS